MSIDWPLVSNVIRRRSVNNTFGMVRKYANGKAKPHQGWDFFAPVGTKTFAIAAGTVKFVHKNLGAYGSQVCISFEHAGTTKYAFYAHLQHIKVSRGDAVELGTLVGTTGDTGNASGLPALDEHLHFEIRTKAVCGLGLAGRISPLKVFGICPLSVTRAKVFGPQSATGPKPKTAVA